MQARNATMVAAGRIFICFHGQGKMMGKGQAARPKRGAHIVMVTSATSLAGGYRHIGHLCTFYLLSFRLAELLSLWFVFVFVVT